MFTRLLSILAVFSGAITFLYAQQWEWVDISNSNGGNVVRVEDVSVDEANDFVYTAGFMNGNNTFGGLPASAGGEDGFVRKYDLSGNLIWSFLIGGTGDDRIQGIEVDPNTNNILVTGFVTGSSASNSVDFQGASVGVPSSASGSIGGEDAFIACYNGLGQLLWHKIVGGTGLDRGMDIAVNSSGTFITGVYTNTAGLSIVSPIVPSNGVVNNFVLAVSSSNGNILWDAVLASDGDEFSPPNNDNFVIRTGITADNNGVYVVNYFNGAVYNVYNSSDVLSSAIADLNTSTQDYVVTSYTNVGNHNWSVLYDNESSVLYGLGITNDCTGVYVSGTLHNLSSTAGGSTINSVHDNFLLSKLDKTTGSEVWLKDFNSTIDHEDHFVGIDVDDYGNLYAVGRLAGTNAVLGTDLNFTSGQAHSEVMIAHFFTDGSFQDFEVLPGTDDSWGMSIATYKNEKYIVGGYFNDDLFFGSLWSGIGGSDGFVAGRALPGPIIYTTTSGNEIAGSPAFCQAELTAIPELNVPSGGVFSGPAQVVFSNTTTGEIDLASSTVGGPYTITYSGSPYVCVTTTLETTIYILQDEDASFTFATDNYCMNGVNPLPTSITTPGGTFSTSGGLVLANASTGEIDLANSTAGGPYWLVYTSPGTCSQSDSIQITINTLPNPDFGYGQASYCSGTGTVLPSFVVNTGGTFSAPAGVTINVSTGEIDLDVSTVGGPYTIQYVVSGALCQDTATFDLTIVQSDNASFTFASTTLCINNPNILPTSVAMLGGTFTSSTGLVVANSATGEIDISASTPGGPYQLYYTTSGATCPAVDSLAFTLLAAVDPTFAYAQSNYCFGTGTILPSAVASPGGTFSGPAGVVFTNTSTGEIDLDASTVGGPYVIQYLTAPSACQSSSTFSLTIDPLQDASFSYASTTFCSNEPNPVVTSIITPGGTFSAPAGLVVNSVTGEIDLAASMAGGPYTIQYVISNTYCSDSTTFSVTIDPVDDASFSYATDHFCNNEANPTPTSIATAGGAFSGPIELMVDPTTGEIDVTASTLGGPYWLVYTTSSPTCSASDSIQVYIESAPDASFNYAQTSFCQGAGTNTLPIAVNSGGTFSAPVGIVINSATGEIDIDASAAGGPYTIEHTVANVYCQKTYTFDLTILEQDNLVSFGYTSNNYCVSDGNQIPVVTGVAGGVFSGPASIDIVNSTTGEISPSTSTLGGPYTIEYTTSGVCPDSLEAVISIFDLVTAYGGEDQELFFVFSSSFEADIPVNAAGEWSSISAATISDKFDPNSDVSDLELGVNTFVWTVSNGVCPAASDEVIIEVQDIFIPQAVTPNGDGKNDFFHLQSLDEATCSLQIFNRWGQLIYENSDYQNEWNGQNSKGDELKDDTYFYIILIDDSISYNGYVVLKK